MRAVSADTRARGATWRGASGTRLGCCTLLPASEVLADTVVADNATSSRPVSDTRPKPAEDKESAEELLGMADPGSAGEQLPAVVLLLRQLACSRCWVAAGVAAVPAAAAAEAAYALRRSSK